MDYKTIQIEGLHNMQFIYNIEYIPKILIIVWADSVCLVWVILELFS
jgi:hypothetical protein